MSHFQERLWKEGRPPEPVGGIPPQRLPGWMRWPIRALLVPLMLFQTTIQRFLLFFLRSEYKVAGQCKRRGNCCHYILLPWPPFPKWLGFLNPLYIWWQTEIYGFYFRGFDLMDGNEITRVMGCRYLQKDGRCGHYGFRPMICRHWPKISLLGKPPLLKGCGLVMVKRSTRHYR